VLPLQLISHLYKCLLSPYCEGVGCDLGGFLLFDHPVLLLTQSVLLGILIRCAPVRLLCEAVR